MMRPDHSASRVALEQHRGQAAVLRLLAGVVFTGVLALATVATNVAHAQGNDPIARFDGGIGSQVWARGQDGAVIQNDVNGTPPGGRPWVIERLTAAASTTRIRAEGRGLLLGGGANVGTPGGQSVRARLFCGGVPFDSAQLVPLDENGDFRIDSGFAGTTPPPSPCAQPRLLIISGGGSWFAAGIPKRR